MLEGGNPQQLSAIELYGKRLWEEIKLQTKKDFRGVVVDFFAKPWGPVAERVDQVSGIGESDLQLIFLYLLSCQGNSVDYSGIAI